MPVHIVITGTLTTKVSYLYEKICKGGRKVSVPTYHANIQGLRGSLFHFAVTRDASDVVFNNIRDRYGVNGECPPSTESKPYRGHLHQTKKLPFGIRLSDQECGKTRYLQGTGDTVRDGILIHHGITRTEGCFTVAGGRRGFEAFKAALEEVGMNMPPRLDIPLIYVHVEPRPKSHHTRWL